MHELGIAKDFWNIVAESARKHKLKRVTKISIVLGEASGIEEEFLRHSFEEHILPGTMAREAQLVITKKPLAARCRACAAEITRDSMKEPCCPRCGSSDIEVISGKETYVEHIEGK